MRVEAICPIPYISGYITGGVEVHAHAYFLTALAGEQIRSLCLVDNSLDTDDLISGDSVAGFKL